MKSQKLQIEKWFENLHNERNNLPGIEGSAWSIFNSVSEYADYNNAGSSKNNADRIDNRLNSMWFGEAAKLKTRAFDAAFALAQ